MFANAFQAFLPLRQTRMSDESIQGKDCFPFQELLQNLLKDAEERFGPTEPGVPMSFDRAGFLSADLARRFFLTVLEMTDESPPLLREEDGDPLTFMLMTCMAGVMNLMRLIKEHKTPEQLKLLMEGLQADVELLKKKLGLSEPPQNPFNRIRDMEKN